MSDFDTCASIASQVTILYLLAMPKISGEMKLVIGSLAGVAIVMHAITLVARHV